MLTRNTILTAALWLSVSQSVTADLLRLKSGSGVQGTLISADANGIRFETVRGETRTYRIADVDGVDFAPLPPPPPPPAPSNVSAAAAAPSVVVPAGTEITVRTIDSIQGSATGAGQRYKASIDDPIVVNNQVVIPRGTNCTIEVVALESGKDVQLRLYDVSVGGKSYATASDFAVVKAEGTSKKRKAARRGVGLGALGAGIGAIAGGGEAAAIGAVVGGSVGAVSAAGAKGKQIDVAPETLLSFKLKSPLPLN